MISYVAEDRVEEEEADFRRSLAVLLLHQLLQLLLASIATIEKKKIEKDVLHCFWYTN